MQYYLPSKYKNYVIKGYGVKLTSRSFHLTERYAIFDNNDNMVKDDFKTLKETKSFIDNI